MKKKSVKKKASKKIIKAETKKIGKGTPWKDLADILKSSGWKSITPSAIKSFCLASGIAEMRGKKVMPAMTEFLVINKTDYGLFFVGEGEFKITAKDRCLPLIQSLLFACNYPRFAKVNEEMAYSLGYSGRGKIKEAQGTIEEIGENLLAMQTLNPTEKEEYQNEILPSKSPAVITAVLPMVEGADKKGLLLKAVEKKTIQQSLDPEIYDEVKDIVFPDDAFYCFLKYAESESAERTKTKLSPEEKKLLAKYEKIIIEAQNRFYSTGNALEEIRKNKLYRKKSQTFEEYVQICLSIGSDYARKNISAYKISKQVDGEWDGVNDFHKRIIQSESQARALLKVKKEERCGIARDAFEKAKSENRKMTAIDMQLTIIAKSKEEAFDNKAHNASHSAIEFKKKWKSFVKSFEDVKNNADVLGIFTRVYRSEVTEDLKIILAQIAEMSGKDSNA